MARRALNLQAAAERARRAGLLQVDFYEMIDDQRRELSALRQQTSWRQSPTSRSLGRSAERAFHSALLRAARRLAPMAPTEPSKDGEEAYRHALRVAARAVTANTRAAVIDVVDAYEVAADAFRETGHEARALRMDENANRWAESLRKLFHGSPRPVTRRQVNGDLIEFSWAPRTRQWGARLIGKDGVQWLPISTHNARTLDEAEMQAREFLRRVRGQSG